MEVLTIKQAEADNNLSRAFQASGLYLMNRFQTDNINTELSDFDHLLKNEAQRNAIWLACKKGASEMGIQEPHILPLIEDLLVYEKAIWDSTFSKYNLQTYRKKRTLQFGVFQKKIKIENKKFKINKDQPFKIFKTKWNWNSEDGVLPDPSSPIGNFQYFIRPTLFRGSLFIKNLLGINSVLPALVNYNDAPFGDEDIIQLIKNGAAPDYDIPSDENLLRQDVSLFIKEQLLLYNSISLVSESKDASPTRNWKSFTL